MRRICQALQILAPVAVELSIFNKHIHVHVIYIKACGNGNTYTAHIHVTHTKAQYVRQWLLASLPGIFSVITVQFISNKSVSSIALLHMYAPTT